jgi:putative spermidine/putrescine transport system substrate-binding protein
MSNHNEYFNLNQSHSRRTFLKRAGVLGASAASLSAFLAACGSASASTTTTADVNKLIGPIDMNTLITNAKKEGKLEAVGIPPTWADYKDILDGYAKNYVPVQYQAQANYSSAQELEVFANSKHHPSGDIGDVGFQFGAQAIQEGLITPYKHSQWNDIPANLKDPNGYWCTEYWGAQAFVVNTDLVKNVPTSFKELLSGNYKNMVGLDGDPRQASDAFMAVYTAAVAMSGKTDDIQPGIDYFAELKKSGNFTVAQSTVANISKGEVAIAVMWDYLGLGYRDQLNGKPNLKVIIPTDASLAGPYVSIINKTAPDPYAARLWMEYIYSDAGQLDYLKGYAHPVRYQTLVNQGKVPASLAAKLPSAESYKIVKFVTDTTQLNNATNTINKNWQSQVLG